MIILAGEEFTANSVKAELERWKRTPDKDEEPALLIVPELKFMARELLHRTGIKWKVIYWPSGRDVWFIVPSKFLDKIEPTDSWIPETNQAETTRFHYRRWVPKGWRKFLGSNGWYKWRIFARRFEIT